MPYQDQNMGHSQGSASFQHQGLVMSKVPSKLSGIQVNQSSNSGKEGSQGAAAAAVALPN